MPPTTTPQANTDPGSIVPPPAAVAPVAPSAQSDQIQASQLSSTPQIPDVASIVPDPSAPPAFHFTAPDMPTVGYVDPSQYTDFTHLNAAEAAAQSNLINQQNSLEKGVFGQYQTAIDSQGSALDRYNKLSQQMNLPLYQQQVNTIKGLLSRLTDNINTRAAGTFMNQAQRDQLEASEGKTLNNQLAPLAQAQTAAESNIAKMMDYTNQDNQAHLDPIKAYLANLSGAFGRQLTGMSENNKGASQALQASIDQKAREWDQNFKQTQAASDEAYRQKTYALEQQKLAAQSKYNDFMAGIARQQATVTPAAAPGPSIAQQNAAQWLNHQPNASPTDIRNYQSNPGITSWTQAAKSGNPLDGIGKVFGGLLTGHF